MYREQEAPWQIFSKGETLNMFDDKTEEGYFSSTINGF